MGQYHFKAIDGNGVHSCALDIAKKYNKEKFMADKPELIRKISPYLELYEHPKFGDEYPLVAVIGNDCFLTYFYDVPEMYELKE